MRQGTGDRAQGTARDTPAAAGFWTTRRYVWLLVAFVVVHALLAVALPVSGDEAYYWDCSRHPDWATYDQPPLMMLAPIPFRALLGETRLAVRGPAILASFLIGVFLLPLVRRLGGGPREAAWAYLVLHATPLFFLGSFYASTDIGMMAGYVGATWAAVAIAQGERRAWWGFGVAVAVGFLAKFPAVLVLPALAPALVRSEVRAHLRTPVPYAAAALAMALTAPVWIWGSRHDWVNLTFQLQQRHSPGSAHAPPRRRVPRAGCAAGLAPARGCDRDGLVARVAPEGRTGGPSCSWARRRRWRSSRSWRCARRSPPTGPARQSSSARWRSPARPADHAGSFAPVWRSASLFRWPRPRPCSSCRACCW